MGVDGKSANPLWEWIRKNRRVLYALGAMALLAFAFAEPRTFGGFVLRIALLIRIVLFGSLGLLVLGILGFFAIPWIRRLKDRRRFRGASRAQDPAFQEWFLGQVRLLRELGFWADRADKELGELARELLESIREDHGDDLLMLRQAPIWIPTFTDPDRVWYVDLEDDGILSEGYVEIIADLARISRGSFHPEQVENDLDEPGPEGMGFSFIHDGVRHHYTPEYMEDWMDLGFVEEFDKLIAPSGMRFHIVGDEGQCVFVVVLREDEKDRLEAAGWTL